MRITQTKLVLLAAVFFVVFDNWAFWAHLTKVYPISPDNLGFLTSQAVFLTSIIFLLLSLVSARYTIKPVLILLLLMSSVASYFMNNYNVVIDHVMIQNVLETNINEASDLFSIKLLFYVFLLGVLPSILLYYLEIQTTTWKSTILTKSASLIGSVLIILLMFFLFSNAYTSFFREHKLIRYYTNPTYYLYSIGKYFNQNFKNQEVIVQALGNDAHIPETDTDRELIVLVIGEAVRADRLSINGYQRETTPLLQKEKIVSFSRMHSCGTSTAYSVPCMFSMYPRAEYSNSKSEATENLLDVLGHAGVHVLWRDNNSDSKGVALRVEYQDYKKPEVNPVCDEECRDIGMLDGLQKYIDGKKEGDIFIVLHQMGNHGPSYYKRYPRAYEHFVPVCRSNQLEKCSVEEINNAYDNAILYTDYFLTQVIQLLEENSAEFETAMFYMSDHGESLGEKGLYLHGLPYLLAPDEQTHVGSFLWFGDSFKIDQQKFVKRSADDLSHDNLFHTILGLLEIETTVYDKTLDIYQQ